MRIEYNSKENWEKKIVCGCKSIFIAESDDIRYSNSAYNGRDVYYVSCPICNQSHYLDDEEDNLFSEQKENAKRAYEQEQDEWNRFSK